MELYLRIFKYKHVKSVISEKMKNVKFTFFVLLSLLFGFQAYAGNVDKAQAEKVAKNFFYEKTFGKGVQLEQIQIADVLEVEKANEIVYYVINLERGGFVIVSAEDQTTPIFGYSDKGAWDADNVAPSAAWLIDSFSDRVLHTRSAKAMADPEDAATWERLLSDDVSVLKRERATVVGPLCERILWNQDSPYNYYCPLNEKGPGGKAYAGCVATAMSIIMNYWRWPLQGEGSHSYYPSTKSCDIKSPEQSANFGETYYDYEGMVNAPAANEFCEPISLLMYHCGVAVEMAYCHATGAYGGSGANSSAVPDAIADHFRYERGNTLNPENMSEANWLAALKKELDKGQPMYYSGYDPVEKSGHAFVCDGYQDGDYFHYDFGWSGSNNGWYSSKAPMDKFTDNIKAITNFVPKRAKGYPYAVSGHKDLAYMSGTIADGSGPLDKYKAGMEASWLIDPQLAGDSAKSITITLNEVKLAAGDSLRFYDGKDKNATLLQEYTDISFDDREDAAITFTSTSSRMFITFASASDSPTADGFLISYKATDAGIKYCTGATTLKTTEGTITDGSPEGAKYSNNADCKWTIDIPNATDDTQIYIYFKYLDTAEPNDRVTIIDWVSKKQVGESAWGKKEGADLPMYVVPSSKAQVQFRTNAFANASGFELFYTTTPIVGLDDNAPVSNLKVFPNPASSHLTVSFSANTTENIQVSLYTLTGQRVYQNTLSAFMGSFNEKIDITSYSKGVYILQVNSSKGIATQKVVIQ